jgi:hypothetical protein
VSILSLRQRRRPSRGRSAGLCWLRSELRTSRRALGVVRGARGPALGVADTGANGGLGSDFRSGSGRSAHPGHRSTHRRSAGSALSGSRYFIAAAGNLPFTTDQPSSIVPPRWPRRRGSAAIGRPPPHREGGSCKAAPSALLTTHTGYDRSDLELVSRHRPDDAALDPENRGPYRRERIAAEGLRNSRIVNAAALME